MRVTVCGYYGFDNAGDELILDSLIRQVRRSDGDADIRVLSARPDTTSSRMGVAAVNRWNPLSVLAAIARCDMLLVGGGGLFQDATSSLSLYYYLSIMAAALCLKRAVVVYAVSFNQLKWYNRAFAGFLMRRAAAITVRDNFSRQVLAGWGCAEKKMSVSADALFSGEAVVVKGADPGRLPLLVYVVRDTAGSPTPGLFARMVERIAGEFPARILFVSLHQERDSAYIRQILEELRGLAAPVEVAQWRQARELPGIIGAADMVVSQRLHGLILSALAGVPFCGISGDSKLISFLDEFHYQPVRLALPGDEVRAAEEVVRVWNDRQGAADHVRRTVELLRARAALNVEMLARATRS